MVPCVMPLPESPVAMYTLSRSSGLCPMNARLSTGSMTWPDQRHTTSPIGNRSAAQRRRFS